MEQEVAGDQPRGVANCSLKIVDDARKLQDLRRQHPGPMKGKKTHADQRQEEKERRSAEPDNMLVDSAPDKVQQG